MGRKTHLTVKELAERAGVDPSWIRHLCGTGEIKAQKAGFMWIIPIAEAERWLRERG